MHCFLPESILHDSFPVGNGRDPPGGSQGCGNEKSVGRHTRLSAQNIECVKEPGHLTITRVIKIICDTSREEN